jgi:hypothetical protein
MSAAALHRGHSPVAACALLDYDAGYSGPGAMLNVLHTVTLGDDPPEQKEGRIEGEADPAESGGFVRAVSANIRRWIAQGPESLGHVANSGIVIGDSYLVVRRRLK